jgi:hypothetical protein
MCDPNFPVYFHFRNHSNVLSVVNLALFANISLSFVVKVLVKVMVSVIQMSTA